MLVTKQLRFPLASIVWTKKTIEINENGSRLVISLLQMLTELSLFWWTIASMTIPHLCLSCRMAFHGSSRPTVCGNLFSGSELGHKYFCVNTTTGTTSTGLSATPNPTGPNAPAGTPRHPASLGGSAGGGAAIPQPHSNPASEVPSPAEMEPDRPIGYGAFGVVWWVPLSS